MTDVPMQAKELVASKLSDKMFSSVQDQVGIGMIAGMSG